MKMTTLIDNLFNVYYLQNTMLSDSMHYPTILCHLRMRLGEVTGVTLRLKLVSSVTKFDLSSNPKPMFLVTTTFQSCSFLTEINLQH